jgi:hypothetical protein
LIPALILAIKDPATPVPDPAKTQKVVGALEEMQFYFRHNLQDVPRFVNASGSEVYRLDDRYRLEKAGPTGWTLLNRIQTIGEYLNIWDDGDLPSSAWTHDHIRAFYGSPSPLEPSGAQAALDEEGRRKAFINNQPLDFSWMGNSAFQGIVYARGKISVDQKFKVVGALISLDDVTLTRGAELIFDEDYRDVFGHGLPIAVISYEEL